MCCKLLPIHARDGKITAEQIKYHLQGFDFEHGDKVIINVFKDTIFITKKNPGIFDKFDSFLPSNFKGILKKMRTDEKERLKRLGAS